MHKIMFRAAKDFICEVRPFDGRVFPENLPGLLYMQTRVERRANGTQSMRRVRTSRKYDDSEILPFEYVGILTCTRLRASRSSLSGPLVDALLYAPRVDPGEAHLRPDTTPGIIPRVAQNVPWVMGSVMVGVPRLPAD